MKTIGYSLLFFTSALIADEATEIIQKINNNIRGQNIYMKMTLKITSGKRNRTMKMENFSKGSKKSFVKTLYPSKSKGITFLSLDNQMWQYIPKIERTIKIPPSMMLQKWMGSDITNDDLVKQSSIVDDYDAIILSRKDHFVTLELTPKQEAAVVWGKIVSTVDTDTYTGVKDLYYDEDNELVRIFEYKDVKQFGKYYLATHWKITPTDKDNTYTEVFLEDVIYDGEISDQYFTKSALKRFSR